MNPTSDKYLEMYGKTFSHAPYKIHVRFFQNLLTRKANSLGYKHRHELFLPRVLSLFKIETNVKLKILEIGIGNGWTMRYNSTNIEKYGIDKGSTFQNELESRNIKFNALDVEKDEFPYDNNFFDIIMLNHVIEHIVNPDNLLSEMHRILTMSGKLYIRCPNISKCKFRFYDDYTHVRPYTDKSLSNCLSAYGFQNLFCFGSDLNLINLDNLTDGKIRKLLLGNLRLGNELESGFIKTNF